MVGRNLMDDQYFDKLKRDGLLLCPKRSELDLLDSESVAQYIAHHKPWLIIHAAGKVGGIQANIQDQLGFYLQNSIMGQNILVSSYKNHVPYVLNIASSCMYPKDCQEKLKEEMILSGYLEPTNEGYALAKIATLKLGQYINEKAQLSNSKTSTKVKTIIPCNLFGKYDNFNNNSSHLIAAIIAKINQAKMSNSKTVEIWGNGEARREFMPASDLAKILSILVQDIDSIPDILNVGTGIDYTINEYYQSIAEIYGWSGDFVHDLSRPVGMKRKLLNIDRLNSITNFKSDIDSGFKEAIQYFNSINQPR